ncbi:hypothetical protein SLS53_003653 [Cytospora paraplurivora]|uniref:Uncharacterized protein n=1 Tax=Cytospora paraplurivora TaxID=2898453 RepID=A0AAN9UCJ1_9PEZI
MQNHSVYQEKLSVLSDVWDSRPFYFKEVDIVDPAAQSWKDLYDFDVPVVCKTSFYSVIHVNKASAPEENPQHVTSALRLMHRFTPDQVKALLDKAEKI